MQYQHFLGHDPPTIKRRTTGKIMADGDTGESGYPNFSVKSILKANHLGYFPLLEDESDWIQKVLIELMETFTYIPIPFSQKQTQHYSWSDWITLQPTPLFLACCASWGWSANPTHPSRAPNTRKWEVSASATSCHTWNSTGSQQEKMEKGKPTPQVTATSTLIKALWASGENMDSMKPIRAWILSFGTECRG